MKKCQEEDENKMNDECYRASVINNCSRLKVKWNGKRGNVLQGRQPETDCKKRLMN